MNSSELEALCTVVEQGSVTVAATSMFCVPSNITKKIKNLEKEFGVALFHRQQNKLILTVQGKAIYGKAKAYLALREQGRALFDEKGWLGQLDIGALDMALLHHLPARIRDYRRDHPNVRLRVVQGYSSSLEQQLKEGELDLIFSDGPVDHPQISSALAFPERLTLVGAYPELLNVLDLYVYPATCHYRYLVDNWLLRHGIKPARVLEVESYAIMSALIDSGLGCAFIPHLRPEQAVAENEVTIPCNIYAQWRKGGLCQLTQAFLLAIGVMIPIGERVPD